MEKLHGGRGNERHKGDELAGYQAKYAFHSAVVGYLALHNMLTLANEHGIVERLPSFSREDFSEWLDRIDREGSVTG